MKVHFKTFISYERVSFEAAQHFHVKSVELAMKKPKLKHFILGELICPRMTTIRMIIDEIRSIKQQSGAFANHSQIFEIFKLYKCFENTTNAKLYANCLRIMYESRTV